MFLKPSARFYEARLVDIQLCDLGIKNMTAKHISGVKSDLNFKPLKTVIFKPNDFL